MDVSGIVHAQWLHPQNILIKHHISLRDVFSYIRQLRKPLAKSQLSTYICKLILNAEPRKSVKVHNIRKYTASCSLAQSINVSGRVNSLWRKSPHTFLEFYMSPMTPLTSKPADESILDTNTTNALWSPVHKL